MDKYGPWPFGEEEHAQPLLVRQHTSRTGVQAGEQTEC